jgi:DNA-binding XRE family transcriptional regulator
MCTISNMTKERAILLAGTPAKLAKLLGVTRQAVNNWDEIPKGRLWQLRVLKPEWFDELLRF